jgi:hypothetical protein
MPALSETGSLLVPLEIDGPATFVVDGVVFTRKVEHHLTVFGSTRGKLLHAAAASDPRLLARVNELAASHAWDVSLVERFVLLSEPAPDGELRTICVMASARVAEFFAMVRALIANASDEASRALAASLASPPPPHVTLYTTDPTGRRGIGLASQAELDEALDHATEGPGELRARWLPTSSAPPARLERSVYLP